MTEESKLVLPGPVPGAPSDAVENTVCPLRSTTTIYAAVGGMSKVSLDVTCRRSCMFYLEENGKPRCAVVILALAMAERA